MVVYTPDQALNPEKKEQNCDDGVDYEIHMESKALTADVDPTDAEQCGDVYNVTTVPVVRERRYNKQKRRLWLQLLLFAGMIFGLTLCILGSVHLYKGIYTTGFRGRCGVGMVDMSKLNLTLTEPEALNGATNAPIELRKYGTEYYEDVEIKGSVETLKVPAVNEASPATIRHDFDRNQTAIRDDILKKCFLLPFLNEFNLGEVPSPKDFSDLLNAMVGVESASPLVYKKDVYFKASRMADEWDTQYSSALEDICEGMTSYSAEPTSEQLEPVGEDNPTTPLSLTTPPLPETTGDSANIWKDNMWKDTRYYLMYPGGQYIFDYQIRF